jgi:hypothetical protein
LPSRSAVGLSAASPANSDVSSSAEAATAAWAVEEEKPHANRFGPLGVVATAILLTILAYLGTIMLLRQ